MKSIARTHVEEIFQKAIGLIPDDVTEVVNPVSGLTTLTVIMPHDADKRKEALRFDAASLAFGRVLNSDRTNYDTRENMYARRYKTMPDGTSANLSRFALEITLDTEQGLDASPEEFKARVAAHYPRKSVRNEENPDGVIDHDSESWVLGAFNAIARTIEGSSAIRVENERIPNPNGGDWISIWGASSNQRSSIVEMQQVLAEAFPHMQIQGHCTADTLPVPELRIGYDFFNNPHNIEDFLVFAEQFCAARRVDEQLQGTLPQQNNVVKG